MDPSLQQLRLPALTQLLAPIGRAALDPAGAVSEVPAHALQFRFIRKVVEMEELRHVQAKERVSLRRLLTSDHARLDLLFRDLLAALRADAREDAARLWNRFDAELSAHLDLEERLILPAFSEENAAEASVLLEQHGQIRRELAELGLGLDLHLTRAEVFAGFVERLRRHAEREDQLMYAWAEQAVPEDSQMQIREQLGKGAKRSVGLR